MPLNAKTAKGGNSIKYEPMEAGVYPARVAQVIDLGVQPQEFKGEKKTPRREILLTYEFLDEFLPDEKGEPNEDKPRWLSETLPLHNLNSERAKSTGRYYALDPNVEQDGDFFALVGYPCNVTVVVNKKKDGNLVNNVANVAAMRPRDAAKAPDLKNPPKTFDTEEPNMEILGSLPTWMQDKIKSSLEWAGDRVERQEQTKVDPRSQNTASAAGEAAEGSNEDDSDEDY
jgi:hypothetical protein